MNQRKLSKATILLSLLTSGPQLIAQELKIDFTPTGQAVESGWAGYFATHEDSSTFTTQTFSAFEGSNNITITPLWADDTVSAPVDGTTVILDGDHTAKQMIKRGQASPQPDLYQDSIGTDSSITAADPLQIQITGVPTGYYTLKTHHHDPGTQARTLNITVDDANGSHLTSDFDQSTGESSTATPSIFEKIIYGNGSIMTLTFDSASVPTDPSALKFVIINGIELTHLLDTDTDGIPDFYEDANGLDKSTNDADQDLDFDGYTNFEEFLGADNIAFSGDETDPDNSDNDMDGLPTMWELLNGLDPLIDDSADDGDADGLSNLAEFFSNTDPNRADTDFDGLPDGFEVTNNLNPLFNDASQDPDQDGLVNFAEFSFGTNPQITDAQALTTTGATITNGTPVLNVSPINGDLAVRFIKRNDFPFAPLFYTVQFSSDLTSWENSSATPTTIVTDGSFEIVEVPYPATLSTGQEAPYFRLRLSTVTPSP